MGRQAAGEGQKERRAKGRITRDALRLTSFGAFLIHDAVATLTAAYGVVGLDLVVSATVCFPIFNP